MAEFTKRVNAETAALKGSALMRIRLTAYEDRSFVYTVHAPSTTWYLKRVTGLTKGSQTPGKDVAGSVSVKACYEIARSKQQFDAEQRAMPLESLVKSVMGSARSMGLRVVR